MATTYRYLFADLLTNEILAELPLTGVSFSQLLNQAGSFQGHLLLSGVDADKYNVQTATVPGRNVIYVDRNGILIWGGVIWGRDYDSDTQTITLAAREFESYFEKRRITTTQAFTNADQLLIARTLVTNAQSVPSGNIGVQIGNQLSGVLLSRTYYSYEYKGVFSALQDLSRADDGFDFNIDVSYDGAGVPTKTLKLGYPRIGTTYTTTSISIPVFEFSAGNVVAYDYPEDASSTANTVYALGAGSNEGKLIAVGSDSTKLSSGWAVLEEQANYSDVSDSSYLAQLASGQVLALSNPVTVIRLIVPAYVNPVLGSYSIGDDVRLRITDSRFPNGLDQVYRIVGISVSAGENGPERVTLSLTTTTN